jgi:hypothetical protein
MALGCNLSDPVVSTEDASDVGDTTLDDTALDAAETGDAPGQSDTDTQNDATDQPDGDTGDTDAASQDTLDGQSCSAGQELCANRCIDTASNPDHCGGCNQRCRPPERAVTDACEQGDCVYVCEDGFFDLNDNIQEPDGDGCEADCRPTNGGVEACDDVDNDCDGQTDEGLTRACGTNTGVCSEGTETCTSGQWGACQGSTDSSPEVCDGTDNDCDGQTDEDYGALGQSCTVGVGGCERSGTIVCSPDGSGTECSASPGSPSSEVCDGVDNDCDGQTDEALSRTCGTNAGTCSTGTETCSGGQWGACQGSIGPSPEVCNGLDDDCDGTADNNGAVVYYRDEDDDGYGTSDSSCTSSGHYTATQSGDCDDSSEYAYPGGPNLYCSAYLDYDCDGVVGCAEDMCSTGSSCVANGQFGTCSGNTCTP